MAPSGARPDRGQGTTRAHRLKYHPRNLPSVHRHVLCNLLRPTATNLRRVELCLISPHRIENSRETTRERNGGHVIAASVRDALRPSPQEEGFGFRLASEHAPGSFDQEPPHAGVTGFRNGPFSLRFARAPLTRHEPQITFELMRVSEPSYTVNRRDKCDGGHRPDAWHRHESPSALIFASSHGHLPVQVIDPGIEWNQERQNRSELSGKARRQLESVETCAE